MWTLIFVLSLSASSQTLKLNSQMWLSLSSEMNLELTTTEKVIKTFSGYLYSLATQKISQLASSHPKIALRWDQLNAIISSKTKV